MFSTVYHPPSSDSAVDERLERNLENAFLTENEMHIHGDFAIDFMSSNLREALCHEGSKKHEYESTCKCHNKAREWYMLEPLLLFASSIYFTCDGSKCRYFRSQMPVFFCRKFRKLSHKSHDIFIRCRRTKNMNKNGLMASLSYVPWDICFR